jgi:hypothetical protein
MLIRHLHNLLHVCPQLLLAWEVLWRLPHTISLVLHVNTTFEDVLGRIHSLQYQQFKHLRYSKHNLKESFKGFPRSKRVRTGRFRLTDETAPDTIYDKFNWSQRIRPGSSLVMPVMIGVAPHAVQNCPQCEQGVTKTEGRTRFCARCGLRWEVLKHVRKSTHGFPHKSVAKAQLKQQRLSKRNRAEITREMLEVTNEMPLEWLMRQGISANLEAHSGSADRGQSADSKNVQQSQASRFRCAHNCSGLNFLSGYTYKHLWNRRRV